MSFNVRNNSPLLQIRHAEPTAAMFPDVVRVAQRQEPADGDVDLGLLLAEEAGQWTQWYQLRLLPQKTHRGQF